MKSWEQGTVSALFCVLWRVHFEPCSPIPLKWPRLKATKSTSSHLTTPPRNEPPNAYPSSTPLHCGKSNGVFQAKQSAVSRIV
jgi:hypothetical protein